MVKTSRKIVLPSLLALSPSRGRCRGVSIKASERIRSIRFEVLLQRKSVRTPTCPPLSLRLCLY
jgi:hypothetical protein